jgi:hypothetical protein
MGTFWRHIENRKVIKTLANLLLKYPEDIFWEHGKELSSFVKGGEFLN